MRCQREFNRESRCNKCGEYAVQRQMKLHEIYTEEKVSKRVK